MFSYSLGLYEKALPNSMPLDEKLITAKRCGYDYMELCVDSNEERRERINWTREQREKAREFSWKMDVPFTTLSLSLLREYPLGLLDRSINEYALSLIDKACQLAVDLGSRVILINGYDVFNATSTDETRERFFENLKKAVNICSHYGVIISIENADMPFCKKVSDAVDICDKLPSKFLGVYADIGNQAIAFNGDTECGIKDLKTGVGHISSVHLKDSLPGQYRMHGLGEGFVDFERYIKNTLDLGVYLYTAEIFYNPDGDYTQHATKVADQLRSFFKTVMN